MAKVLAVRGLGGRGDKYKVLLDDGSSLVLAGMVAMSLTVGQELTALDLDNLEQRNQAELAYEKALHYLSYRPRSEAEVVKYLAGKGMETVSTEVLGRLKRAGLVDDTEFASQWVENRNTHRPRSRWALQCELRRAGVAREVIDQAVKELNEDEGALRAGQRKAQQLRMADQLTFRRRLLAFLQRRGYGYDVADKAVKVLWRQVGSDTGDESSEN